MNLLAKTEKEILTVLEPIMDNLMEGSTEINYEKHSRDFTDRLKKIVTKERLNQICKDYQEKWGKFQKREFVALFRREHSVAVVWKQQVSKSSDEFVAEAVFMEQDGRYVVDHAFVF